MVNTNHCKIIAWANPRTPYEMGASCRWATSPMCCCRCSTPWVTDIIQATVPCKHRWIIDAPSGPLFVGDSGHFKSCSGNHGRFMVDLPTKNGDVAIAGHSKLWNHREVGNKKIPSANYPSLNFWPPSVRALRDAEGVAGVDLLFVHEVSTGKECVNAKIEVPSCRSNL